MLIVFNSWLILRWLDPVSHVRCICSSNTAWLLCLNHAVTLYGTSMHAAWHFRYIFLFIIIEISFTCMYQTRKIAHCYYGYMSLPYMCKCITFCFEADCFRKKNSCWNHNLLNQLKIREEFSHTAISLSSNYFCYTLYFFSLFPGGSRNVFFILK